MATEQHDEKRSARAHRKPMALAAAEHSPLIPNEYEKADALSIQRFAAGRASEVEQKRAFAWIMRCTGYTDEPYRPGGEDGRRDTDFALGKANVGRQIAKLLHLDMTRVRGSDGEQP
jgi:hypothetical protein